MRYGGGRQRVHSSDRRLTWMGQTISERLEYLRKANRNSHWINDDLYRLLKTVYTRAGEELTDPQEGCKLRNITNTSSGEQPCLGVRQCSPYRIYGHKASQ